MFDLCWAQQHSSAKFDHGIFSVVIFALLLIQKGQLSVCGNRMYTSTGYPLKGLCLPNKSVAR